jgi:hypothetical protein
MTASMGITGHAAYVEDGRLPKEFDAIKLRYSILNSVTRASGIRYFGTKHGYDNIPTG